MGGRDREGAGEKAQEIHQCCRITPVFSTQFLQQFFSEISVDTRDRIHKRAAELCFSSLHNCRLCYPETLAMAGGECCTRVQSKGVPAKGTLESRMFLEQWERNPVRRGNRIHLPLSTTVVARTHTPKHVSTATSFTDTRPFIMQVNSALLSLPGGAGAGRACVHWGTGGRVSPPRAQLVLKIWGVEKLIAFSGHPNLSE